MLKTLFLEKTGSGAEGTGMKRAFFDIFDPTWTHILIPQGTNIEFFIKNLNFQPMRKKKLYHY